jgi:tetratricopeptide (TPR) repeat protein
MKYKFNFKIIRIFSKLGLPLLVFLVSFSVYVFTLSPSITAGDSTEMVNAALILGVPHQPSYPVYTVLGHLFSKLPLGPGPVWRVNLMSAFFEALACVLIYFIIVKLGLLEWLGEKVLAAGGALFLGFSLMFWQYGTKAEVFALNNFLLAFVVLVALIASEKQGEKWWFLTAFLAAFTFCHHQTAIMLGPALLYLFVRNKTNRGRLKDKKFWLKGMVSGFLGVLPYYLILTLLAKADPALNWGNPVGLDGVLRALRRADFGTFQAYLVGFEPTIRNTPVDQIVFYLGSLITDFTILGMILGVVGAFWAFKKRREIFNLVILGFGGGVFFLAYANFPLGDAFNQATTKRFQLLPDLFFAVFLAFGSLFLWQRFIQLLPRPKKGINLFAAIIVFALLSLSFLVPLGLNFSQANNRNNLVTMKYALDFYPPTEPNAIIMLSGDVPNFAAHFVKTVVLGGDKRIVFTPGQFHLQWFIPQLTSRHPDLVIPEPMEGKSWTTTSQVIWANLGKRPIYISPELVFHDPQVEEDFVLWPKNLLFKIGKKGEEMRLEPYRDESQQLWESLDPAEFAKVRKNNPLMENVIINYYARHFHNLGFMYDSVKLYEDAIREYKRAVEIDPYLADSLKNLGLIYGMKLEPRDYQKGIDYLSKYISLVQKEQPEMADSARYTIAKILEEQQKEMKEWEEKMATFSAETEE